MKQTLLITTALIITSLMLVVGCSSDGIETADKEAATNFQSTPKAVMEEIIRAANTEDYSNLPLLCAPDGSGDRDTRKYICAINDADDAGKKEFISYYKTAKITGEATIEGNNASIPFWFNHPGGEGRSNETMNMVKIEGKWYLSSF
ncbi:MAG: hypothetical protein QF757_05315 [Candidatus Marinimicrobia bacterium]|jgi:hypothetical protein|nr:hypothetical protein [Candidatus Neomarinimicrobiota bacterium]